MRALLLSLIALLVLAAPAAAAPTWLTPINLSPTSAGDVPDIAIASDSAGRVAGVWTKGIGGGNYRIEYSLRSPGGGFTSAVTIPVTGATATAADIGIDASGTATVVWEEDSAAIKSVRIGPDGGRSPVQTLSATGAGEPRVAVAANGAGVVVWRQGTQISAATRTGAADDFSIGAAISQNGVLMSGGTQVAVDPGGDAVAVWIRDGKVEANRRPAGGSFRAPGDTDTLSAAGATTTALALAPDGRATALWSFTGPIVQWADRTISPSFADGTWSGAGTASPAGTQASNPSVALDAENTAVAVWQAKVGTDPDFVQAATRPAGGSFSGYQPLSGAGATGFSSSVDVAPDGAAVAIWVGLSGAQPAVQAARRPAGGAFGAVTDIALGVDLPADPTEDLFAATLAVDDQGNAAAIWSRFRFSMGLAINEWSVEGAGFDAAAPTLAAVSVPPGASAGAGVGMAAAATDRWTPVALSWSFGDGTSAPGGAVTHAFGSAGAFNVTVTATDGVGNASSAARPILITGPTAVPRIDSTVQSKWGFDRKTGKKFYLFRLKVVAPPKGSVAQLRCAGKRCPFQSRRFKRIRKGDITLYKSLKPSKVLKKKNRRFRAGQTVQLRVTAPGYTGKVVRYRLKKRKQPVGKVLCLPEGAKKPRSC